MTDRLGGLLASVGSVSAAERAAFAERARAADARGVLLLETCHRVELYGPSTVVEDLGAIAPRGAAVIVGKALVRHLVRLAVGLESAVVAEDQILHQLRTAAAAARGSDPLPRALDRLVDMALAAGRQARSWFPARRGNLAALAISRCEPGELAGKAVLVVGAGKMGSLAVEALVSRHARALVTSRTPERARAVGARWHVPAVDFDPGPDVVGGAVGVVLALAGPWPASPETLAAIARSEAWIADLSAPPALDPVVTARLSRRVVHIDDLIAEADDDDVSPMLAARLDRLVESTVSQYEQWADRESQRNVAEALAAKAAQARTVELTALWRRIPSLDAAARAEVERMANHLTERLLRDPLERLGDDADGRQAQAARDFFRL